LSRPKQRAATACDATCATHPHGLPWCSALHAANSIAPCFSSRACEPSLSRETTLHLGLRTTGQPACTIRQRTAGQRATVYSPLPRGRSHWRPRVCALPGACRPICTSEITRPRIRVAYAEPNPQSDQPRVHRHIQSSGIGGPPCGSPARPKGGCGPTGAKVKDI
jgi:hypothetical protein